MENTSQKKHFKKSLILFIIGLLFVIASVFAIWAINDILGHPTDASPKENMMSMNFMGWLGVGLLSSVPIVGAILLIVFACGNLKLMFRTKEHPIKNSFVVHLFAVLGIMIIGLAIGLGTFLTFTIHAIYIVWLIYALTIILLLLVVWVTSLIKFIIELVKDWKLVRNAILETRIILGNRTNKQ